MDPAQQGAGLGATGRTAAPDGATFQTPPPQQSGEDATVSS